MELVLKPLMGVKHGRMLQMPLFNILCSVHFLNTDTGYVGDWEGNLIKTTDGGIIGIFSI